MRVQAQSRIIPNVFNVGNVVKRLIWTRMMETEFYLPDTFPTQESAIEAAIQAGQQKIDAGFVRGSVVVNG